MSTQSFKQAPHKLLVIPGPIEVADDVLFANAHPAMSHVSPEFIPVFGDCIRMLREVLFAPNAQPVLTAGSGTLGWDHVAANVLQPGEDALVLNSGYFGDSFADCLETYGAKVDQIKAPIGSKPSLDEVEAALAKKKYKVLTFTHVDTSTGVLSDAKGLGELVKRVSPETILVLDGVCSVGSEEIRMDEWGIDVVLTATQKGLGCPPGLMVLAASKKAIAAFEKRTVPPNSYFASWSRWLPVMKAYEAGTGAYFATPPTNLIYALHASLTTITKGSPSLEERFQQPPTCCPSSSPRTSSSPPACTSRSRTSTSASATWASPSSTSSAATSTTCSTASRRRLPRLDTSPERTPPALASVSIVLEMQKPMNYARPRVRRVDLFGWAGRC
jgi:alanine-glyoxylate transaminase/serine-glyoxylate transaminase/serine-pyruvate transaminase